MSRGHNRKNRSKHKDPPAYKLQPEPPYTYRAEDGKYYNGYALSPDAVKDYLGADREERLVKVIKQWLFENDK